MTYQQRLMDEKLELDKKLTKLISFFDSQWFFTLPEAEKNRMEMQSYMMKEYSSILNERIKDFKKE